jgi:predicted nuclease of predicted toxin-antitoxin system
VKFLVDAQLPRRLVAYLRESGLEAFHTLDLPGGNRTSDHIISELSRIENFIVITKDSDFLESFVIRREPSKLLLISTGNISNDELVVLFRVSIDKIVEGFQTFDFIELGRSTLIFHV